MDKHELELAWAAGLFDGEGCCCRSQSTYRYQTKSEGLKEKKYVRGMLSINQYHDPFVLNRFVAAVGVGRVNGPYPAKATGNPYWYVHLGVKKSLIVLGKLFPYLSEPKRKQALFVFPDLASKCSDIP